jgi:uncharacterized protein (DUF2147 family)
MNARCSARRMVCASIALSLALAPAAAEELDDAIMGVWGTQGMSAKVAIAPCPAAAGGDAICGTILWLWEPLDSAGRSKADAENPDPSLRARPLIGTRILADFRRPAPGELARGSIYNPEDGRTYAATLRPLGTDTLLVEGCFLFICRKQIWRKASAICAGP